MIEGRGYTVVWHKRSKINWVTKMKNFMLVLFILATSIMASSDDSDELRANAGSMF